MNTTHLVSDGASSFPPEWILAVPKGEFGISVEQANGKVDFKTQVVDARALSSLKSNFDQQFARAGSAGLLIDFDHGSYDLDKSSAAAGWAKEAQIRADGLWLRIEWTDIGSAAVKNGRYRFISPVWLSHQVEHLGNGRIRPLRLDSVGLTNKPNMKGMAPLSNRRTSGNISDDDSDSVDAISTFTALVNRKKDALKIPFADAWQRTQWENPELYKLAGVKTSTEPLLNRRSKEQFRTAQAINGLISKEEASARITELTDRKHKEIGGTWYDALQIVQAENPGLSRINAGWTVAEVLANRRLGNPEHWHSEGARNAAQLGAAKQFLKRVYHAQLALNCSWQDAIDACAEAYPHLYRAQLGEVPNDEGLFEEEDPKLKFSMWSK